MELIILGSSSSIPTKNRGMPSFLVKHEGTNLLFDCGEGTQQQFMKASQSFMKINHIFISHLHSDHFLGLPGMIATMSLLERTEKLIIFGPKGIKELLKSMQGFNEKTLSYTIEVKELRKGIMLKEKDLTIEAFPVKHSVKCFGFNVKEKDKDGEFDRKKAEKLGIPVGPLYAKLQKGKNIKFKGKTFKPEQVMNFKKRKKGRKISIVLDTIVSESYIESIKESDLLLHESCFLEKDSDRAIETKHSIVKEVGKLAKKAKVKKLVLTHFSSRYKNLNELLKEAKQEFSESYLGKDFEKFKLLKN